MATGKASVDSRIDFSHGKMEKGFGLKKGMKERIYGFINGFI